MKSHFIKATAIIVATAAIASSCKKEEDIYRGPGIAVSGSRLYYFADNVDSTVLLERIGIARGISGPFHSRTTSLVGAHFRIKLDTVNPRNSQDRYIEGSFDMSSTKEQPRYMSIYCNSASTFAPASGQPMVSDQEFAAISAKIFGTYWIEKNTADELVLTKNINGQNKKIILK